MATDGATTPQRGPLRWATKEWDCGEERREMDNEGMGLCRGEKRERKKKKGLFPLDGQ